MRLSYLFVYFLLFGAKIEIDTYLTKFAIRRKFRRYFLVSFKLVLQKLHEIEVGKINAELCMF